MTATVYGAADRLPLSGGTLTGPLVLNGSPAMQIPSGAASGDVLTSDGSGNASWQAGVTAALGWVSVLQFGAVGNGSTDNTAAFTAALAAAAPANPYATSTTVWVPPGFWVTGPLTIPHGVTLRGAGPRATTLIAKAGMAAGPFITNATHAEMVCVMDLRLQGNSQNQTHTINGLVFSGNWTYSSGTDEYNDLRCRAINLHIEYFNGDGIQSLYKHDSIFQNIQVWEVGGNGVYSTNDDYLNNIDCGNCGLDGFLVAGNALISNCKAWFCGWSGGASTVTSSSTTTGSGFHITSTAGGTLANCYAQDNGRNGFYFDGTANVSAVGLVADSNNNNSSSLTFSGFEFANYAGPVLCSGHTWDRGANPLHQASAVRFNPASAPGGVVLELTWLSNSYMSTLLSSDTTAANLELNSVTILNNGGAGQTTYGPQAIYGGVTVDTLAATAGATITGTTELLDATAPSSNPSGGIDLYSASSTATPARIRDTAGNIRSLADGFVQATANQTSTATAQTASTYLHLAVEASATYVMECGLIFSESNASGSFTASWTGPSGATMQWCDTGTSADYAATIGATSAAYTGSTANRMVFFKGLLAVSTTAGTLTLTFATSSTSYTATVLAGSYLRLARVK
jgi:hypothetical protein